MSNKQKIGFIAALVLIIYSNNCLALENINLESFNSVTTEFQENISTYTTVIKGAATRLFWTLLTFSLITTGIRLIFISGNVQTFTGVFVKLIITTGIFYFLLDNGPAIGADIIDSLSSITDDRKVGPSELFTICTSLSVKFMNLISEGNLGFFGSLMLALPCLFFFYVMAMVVVRYGVLYLTAYSLCILGVFVLGFGAFNYTREIAVNYLRAILSYALQLMVTILVCNAGFKILERLFSSISELNRPVVVQDCLVIVFTGLFIRGIVETLPSVVGSLVTPTGSTKAPIAQNAGSSVKHVMGSTLRQIFRKVTK